MKTLFSLLFLLLSSILPLDALTHSVIVSVAPHKYFIEKIAGDTLKVIVIVPASSTPHSFEPAPKQIIEAGKADIWFRIGEGFEKNAIASLTNHNKNLAIVDLRKGLPLVPGDHHHHCGGGQCCSQDGADLHIWLSLKMANIEANTIAESLIKTYPENEALYRENLKKFLGELSQLDDEITLLLQPYRGRTIMVSHPAYAYFVRDYGLNQLSIEFEGKEPTPQAMNRTLQKARSLKVKTIFTQAQYNVKGAQLIANLLSAKIVDLDPYSENYLPSMKKIAHEFWESFQEGS